MNIALLISYDGTHFSGWQIQKNGRTVQGTLEEALHRAFGIRVRVKLVAPNTIQRSEGKARRVIDHRER